MSSIITHKAACFTSKYFKDWCSKHNVNNIENNTGVSRGNGQVKRINQLTTTT